MELIETLRARCPQGTQTRVQAAALRDGLNLSEWLRSAIMAKLAADHREGVAQ